MRAINSPDMCCSSIATGPPQAKVSVVPDSRRGTVTAAKAGPTMAVQSERICVVAGERRRKAGRVSPATRPATARGPATYRLSPVSFVAIPRAVPPQQTAPAADLLAWYDRHRRRMPWRHEPGEAADPYRVWLSEIMLQQTTVAAVIPYFQRFVTRFPSVAALAAAEEAEVMAAWAGLGYYARARNLHACAKQVAALGAFPQDIAGLRSLPGIGAYTSAAIAAIAFGIPVVPIDGNVERVVARLGAITLPLPAARDPIARGAAALAQAEAARARPSDFAQALFDLGATICTPANPACALCPLAQICLARAAGIAAELPRKAAKKPRPTRYGAHFWLTDAAGRVLLRRRPPRGLLGGMTELPGTPWRPTPWTPAEAEAAAPTRAVWRPMGQARHGLTHFELLIDVYAASVASIEADGFLRPADALDAEALPTVMRKCVTLAQGGAVSHPGPRTGFLGASWDD